ncbi:CPBP family intramembrane glutamic endopeptidase [Sphingomonas asaccharolytica]|uniref:CPBP family intramembrane glutamic endopeptidase n=1 Tax=Sphingomonas asaccharolytica TaxID=40681 RepID=UPI000833A063|nr:CPBP family intramembrane glutamic endopeptidase [Sphingomonas asaccharolytica]
MTNAILLAIMLAIVALNVVAGPRGYRLLAEAGGVGRKTFYRRMLAAQLFQFTLPPIVGLLVLGRIGAVTELPPELWSASAMLRGDAPAVPVDPLLTSIFGVAVLVAIPLGAFLTWRRNGKGAPAYLARLSALLPRDRDEVLLGAAISVAAGIGEELFFRLLLPMLLAAFVGGIPAVIVAILLFGLAHAYQGWKGVTVTALVGILFTAMYLMSGSLAMAMLFHATIDLMTLAIRPAIRGAWRKEAA